MALMERLQQQALYQTVTSRYQQLTKKDQRALKGLLAFLAGALFYVLFWQPVSAWSEQQKQDFQHQRSVHQWVSAQVEHMPVSEPQTETNTQSLSSMVTQSAKQAGLTLSRVQPGNNKLSVWLEKTPYPELLPWLEALEFDLQLTIEQVRIERLERDGEVKAFIQLSS